MQPSQPARTACGGQARPDPRHLCHCGLALPPFPFLPTGQEPTAASLHGVAPSAAGEAPHEAIRAHARARLSAGCALGCPRGTVRAGAHNRKGLLAMARGGGAVRGVPACTSPPAAPYSLPPLTGSHPCLQLAVGGVGAAAAPDIARGSTQGAAGGHGPLPPPCSACTLGDLLATASRELDLGARSFERAFGAAGLPWAATASACLCSFIWRLSTPLIIMAHRPALS